MDQTIAATFSTLYVANHYATTPALDYGMTDITENAKGYS